MSRVVEGHEQTFAELADKNTDLLAYVREKRTLLSREADLLERLLAAESGGGASGSFEGGGGDRVVSTQLCDKQSRPRAG